MSFLHIFTTHFPGMVEWFFNPTNKDDDDGDDWGMVRFMALFYPHQREKSSRFCCVDAAATQPLVNKQFAIENGHRNS